MMYDNLSVKNGHLQIAGQDAAELAAKYGTPLYLMDEDRIRQRCRTYREAVKAHFGDKGRVLYASKAASYKRLYEIMKEEGMGIDVVSIGEIYTADRAGFDLGQAVFHSNNKTDADIVYAMDKGIGYFVIDNEEELLAIERIATGRQKVLIRLTPGIDPHTYEAVATGKVDSKFGFAIATGQATDIVEKALGCGHIELCGFHCHVGSQVFDSEVFRMSADVMLRFMAQVKAQFGFEAHVLDLGGGFGVPYVAGVPMPDIDRQIAEIADCVKGLCAELGLGLPTVCFEPGRSMVADSGVTLYTVGSCKTIPGYLTYVSVDGGMTDNVRHAMYGAPYTLLPATKMDEPRALTVTVAGRCCESGDILQKDVPMPNSIARGDLLACLTTGAYHYSMASNYNRIPRPPVVMLRGGDSYIAVRRETLEDLTHLDE